MFTGIVEEIGNVVSVPSPSRAGELVIAASTVLEDVRLGDSIAVNGVCLTVTDFARDRFSADVMPETLNRSNLGSLRRGSHVNLERAMQLGGRLGGHIVSGHIDGTGTVRSRTADQNAVRIRIACAPPILALVVEKGSIAIDGISLTVAGVYPDSFEVSIIPHTGGQTTLLDKRAGDLVNLENDVVGKYVSRLLASALGRPPGSAAMTDLAAVLAGGSAPGVSANTGTARRQGSGITLDYLLEQGF